MDPWENHLGEQNNSGLLQDILATNWMEPQGHGIAGSRLVLGLNSPRAQTWRHDSFPSGLASLLWSQPQTYHLLNTDSAEGTHFLVSIEFLCFHMLCLGPLLRGSQDTIMTPLSRGTLRSAQPSLKSKKTFHNAVGQSRIHSHRVLQAEPKTTVDFHSCHRHILGDSQKDFLKMVLFS